MTRSITLADLRRAKACAEQAKLFEELFPYGATFETEAEAVAAARAVAGRFDWWWAAQNLLNRSALETCRAVEWSAFEAYEASMAEAFEAYKAGGGGIETYRTAMRSASEAYKATVAETFARAWWNDTTKEDGR